MSAPDERTAVDHLEVEERDPEATAEDTVEQVRSADPAEEETDEPVRIHDATHDEGSEWDVVEQARVVNLDDEYRGA